MSKVIDLSLRTSTLAQGKHMKASRVIALNTCLLAAAIAGAQAQTSTPPEQATATQSSLDTGATKADKVQDKEVKRRAKYNKKAEKNRVSALKDQEKAAKSKAKTDKQRDKSDVDEAKAATNQQVESSMTNVPLPN